jgi:hypothetical protein
MFAASTFCGLNHAAPIVSVTESFTQTICAPSAEGFSLTMDQPAVVDTILADCQFRLLLPVEAKRKKR